MDDVIYLMYFSFFVGGEKFVEGLLIPCFVDKCFILYQPFSRDERKANSFDRMKDSLASGSGGGKSKSI